MTGARTDVWNEHEGVQSRSDTGWCRVRALTKVLGLQAGAIRSSGCSWALC